MANAKADPYVDQSVLRKVKVTDLEGPVEASKDILESRKELPLGDRKLSDASISGIQALEKAIKDQQTRDKKAVELAKEVVQERDSTKVGLGEVDEETARKFQTVFYRNTPVDNERTRKKIESRCSPMDFEDLILSGRVMQRIPIIPGKLEVTFQSLQTRDLMWLDSERSTRFPQDSMEGVAWSGYAKLTMSLVGVNTHDYISCFDKDGVVDQEQFERRYNHLVKNNDKMTEILFVNYGWFEDRVLRMFSTEEEFEQLKNG